MSAKRSWKMMKSPIVFWGSNMPSTASKKPPEASNPGSASGQRIKSWEFDFSTEVQPKKVESLVAVDDVDVDDDGGDDDVNVIPPTQDIDDDDDDDDEGGQNSAGTSPILSAAPEPSFKRLKLNADDMSFDELRPSTSVVRSIDFETFSETPKQKFEPRSASAQIRANLPKRSILNLSSTHPNVDDDDEVCNVSTFDSQSSDDNGDIDDDNDNVDDGPSKNVETKKVENVTQKNVDNGQRGLTPSEWVKRFGNPVRRPVPKLSPDDVGQISSASSPSQSNIDLTRCSAAVNDPLTDSLKKRRNRAKYGLGLKLEAVMKKRESDRVLSRHISDSKVFGAGFAANVALSSTLRGRIIDAQKVKAKTWFVSCRNLQMKPGSAATFKFAATQSDKSFSVGDDVTIHGPWTSSISSAGVEVLASFDRFELTENSSETPKKFSRKILFESDCRCHEIASESGTASGSLSRSKRSQSETESLIGAEPKRVRDT